MALTPQFKTEGVALKMAIMGSSKIEVGQTFMFISITEIK